MSGSGIQSFANDLAQDFQVCQSELVQMGVTALGLSVLITIAFRFLAGLIVYAIIALVVVAVITGTIALWVIWWLKKSDMAERSEVLDSLDTLSPAMDMGNLQDGSLVPLDIQGKLRSFNGLPDLGAYERIE